MAKIIPVIIAEDFWAVKEKAKYLEPYFDWAQIDVADGKFVQNYTWNKPEDLERLEASLNLEIHLMIEKPEDHIKDWVRRGVKKIIFHFEATEKVQETIDLIRENGLEVGLAVNPETEIDSIKPYIDKIDSVLFLTVNPGQTGQKFLDSVLGKISQFKKEYNTIIEVDGGINLETAPKAIRAGATNLAIGSAVFEVDNLQEIISQFQNIQ